MANEIVVTKTYTSDPGTPLNDTDLDAACDSIETYFNVTKLSNDQVQDAGIAASNLDWGDGVYTQDSPQVAIINQAITAVKIADAAVTNVKAANLQHNDLSGYTTASAAQLNQVAVSSVLSGSIASFSSATVTQIASISLVTAGRPVRIQITGAPDGSEAFIRGTNPIISNSAVTNGTDTRSNIIFRFEGGSISYDLKFPLAKLSAGDGVTADPINFYYEFPWAFIPFDPTAPGTSLPAQTYTISLRIDPIDSQTIEWQNIRFLAYEI